MQKYPKNFPRSYHRLNQNQILVWKIIICADYSSFGTTELTVFSCYCIFSWILQGSEDEHELKNSVQEISNTEILLNSTPIDLTNVVTPQQNNAATKKLNAILSKKQLRNSNSLSGGSSPRKPSPAHNSSAPTSRVSDFSTKFDLCFWLPFSLFTG